MPYFASEGNPRRLRMEVVISTAIAAIVIDPLAVEMIFLRPDAVTDGSVTAGADFLLIYASD